MNFILSIFLCLAMIFGGTGELPAAPETETAWTVRNVTLELGGQEFALSSAARLAGYAGQDCVGLRFNAQNGGGELLPIALELTSEGLRASFGSGDRVYTLDREEIEKLDEDGVFDMAQMEIIGGIVKNYGALLGTILGDSERAQAYGQSIAQMLLDACAVEIADAEVEVDGATVPAQKLTLLGNAQSGMAILDGLREGDVPELAEILNSLLRLGNLLSETNFESFAEVNANGYVPDFSIPVVITAAEGDGFSYALLNCAMALGEGGAFALQEEVVAREAQTDVNAFISMNRPSISAASFTYNVAGQMFGPSAAPTSAHLDVDMNAVLPPANASGYDGAGDTQSQAETVRNSMHATLDWENADGQNDLRIAFPDVDGSPASVEARWSEREESDGSATASVALSIASEGATVAGLRFELNRAVAGVTDYFAGAAPFEVTAEMLLEADEEDPPTQLVLAGVTADAMQTFIDAMQLAQDPGVQSLIETFSIGMD